MKKSITLFTAILSIFFLLIGCSAKGDEKASATKTEKGEENRNYRPIRKKGNIR